MVDQEKLSRNSAQRSSGDKSSPTLWLQSNIVGRPKCATARLIWSSPATVNVHVHALLVFIAAPSADDTSARHCWFQFELLYFFTVAFRRSAQYFRIRSPTAFRCAAVIFERRLRGAASEAVAVVAEPRRVLRAGCFR